MISETINWNCYKVAHSLPLLQIASFFSAEEPLKWKKYIKIDGHQLTSVLKCGNQQKSVFLFEFGCITFVNFTQEEKGRMFDLFESISCHMSNDLLSRYHETFQVQINKLKMFQPFPESTEPLEYNDCVVPVIATALAKDTALSSLEDDIDNLLDESEGIIESLRRAKLNINVIKYARKIATLLRFQYNSANSVRVFDRSDTANSSIAAKQLYNEFMKACSFSERVNVLRQKSGELRHIFDMYASLSQSWKENRLLYFEIFLLALFDLPLIFNFKGLLYFILSFCHSFR